MLRIAEELDAVLKVAEHCGAVLWVLRVAEHLRAVLKALRIAEHCGVVLRVLRIAGRRFRVKIVIL